VAVKKKRWKTGQLHWPGSRRGHEKNIAERLTPLEETDGFKKSHQAEGEHATDDTIHVDSSSVRVPEQLVDEDREGANIFRLEPVVLFLIAVMLAFIAFIAWQVTLMPEKRDDPPAASGKQ
jgi:hypothetical protein